VNVSPTTRRVDRHVGQVVSGAAWYLGTPAVDEEASTTAAAATGASQARRRRAVRGAVRT
jgi:hypothetical protein